MKSQKNQEIKEEIKKELEESIVNSENMDNMEFEQKSKMGEKPKATARIIWQFEEIVRNNKKTLFGQHHNEIYYFRSLKRGEKFYKMITKFGVSRSTTSFKIAIFGIINMHSKMENSSLSFQTLRFSNKHTITIIEIYKKNASEY